MDYVDWCEQILDAMIALRRSDAAARGVGVHRINLAKYLLGEERVNTSGFEDTPASRSMVNALLDLSKVGLVETKHKGFFYWQVTDLGLDHIEDRLVLWNQIGQRRFKSDTQKPQLIQLVNRLSQHIAVDYVSLEWVEEKAILAELDWPDARNTLWAVSEELKKNGLVAVYPALGSTRLQATYQSLVWETRYEATIERTTHLSSQPVRRFRLNDVFEVEENRTYEFKEVTGSRPVDTIKNTADEYAVAFLNSEGGQILWGVRNSDRKIVGVRLSYQDRDELRRLVSEKLHSIQPPVDPTAFRIEIHPVYNEDDRSCADLYIVEVVVPASSSNNLYATGGNEVWVKTDAGKKKLTVSQIQDWTRRRVQK